MREIFADPSNETPAIVLAVASLVAVAAFPEVSWFSVATLAAARVPELMFDAFVVSVVAEVARPSSVLTCDCVSSSAFPAPLDTHPKILLFSTFSNLAKVTASLSISDVPTEVRYPAPLVIALLLRDMFAEPSKETPAMVRAFAKTVAVAAFPVQDPDEPEALPVTFPVNGPVKPSATKVPVKVPPELLVSNFLELL